MPRARSTLESNSDFMSKITAEDLIVELHLFSKKSESNGKTLYQSSNFGSKLLSLNNLTISLIIFKEYVSIRAASLITSRETKKRNS